MKALSKDVLLRRNQVEHTRNERAILEAVVHPFIVQLRFAFQTRDKLFIVTDFASGGELFFWLKRDRVFSQARARLYAAELVLALEALHERDIVYRCVPRAQGWRRRGVACPLAGAPRALSLQPLTRTPPPPPILSQRSQA